MRFGPRWRVLRSLALGADQALATLELEATLAAEDAQFALHPALVLDDLADLAHLVFRQILDPDLARHLRLRQDVVRAREPDAEDVRERHVDALVEW